jgi:addiction module HigA family antidote
VILSTPRWPIVRLHLEKIAAAVNTATAGSYIEVELSTLAVAPGRSGGGRDRGLPLEEDATMTKKLKPMHPGEVLREDFLVPLKMSARALAKACGLPRTRVERIASEQTGITADTALRLAKALGTTAQLWLNLQNDYDVQIAKRDLGKILDCYRLFLRPPIFHWGITRLRRQEDAQVVMSTPSPAASTASVRAFPAIRARTVCAST